jgi:hypothetical protein
VLPDGTRQIMAYLVPGDFCDLHVFILKAMDHCIATLSPCKVVYRPQFLRHRIEAYAASAADGSWFCRTALGVWKPCRAISQVEL